MGILENGTALVENLVLPSLATAASKLVEAPLGLTKVATRLVEALAINSVTEKTTGTRMRSREPIITASN